MSSATGAGEVIAVRPKPWSVTAAARASDSRLRTAWSCSAMASARRPRGLPSISVFLSTGAASPLATDPTAATSAVPPSKAVVHGLVVVVPPPVLPPPVLPPLLLLPPPPHAARNTETNAALRRARVRDIRRLSTGG